MSNKIAILYSGGKGWGGIETYLKLLFENFSDPDLELILFSLGDWQLTRDVAALGKTVKVFPKTRIGVTTIFHMSDEIQKGDYRLIVSNGNISNAYARAGSFLTKVPSLVTIHSDFDFDYPNPVTRFIYRLIDRVTRFETRHYLAVSEFLSLRLKASSIKPDAIDVVYNSVPKPTNLLKKSSNEQNIIGSIGRLHHVKGFHNLIEALTLLPGTQLRIAGEGAEIENLRMFAASRGVQARVDFVGHVFDPYEFIADLDVYVQPSLSEGFGLSVLEAMLAAKPVVVTPVGSLREIVSDGETGLVSHGTAAGPLATAIKSLLDSKSLREKLGANAKKFAEGKFTIENWIKGTAEVYKKAIK